MRTKTNIAILGCAALMVACAGADGTEFGYEEFGYESESVDLGMASQALVPACITDPVFGTSTTRNAYINSEADDVADFASVINTDGNAFVQDIKDNSGYEGSRLTADQTHLFYKIPSGKSGSNADTTGTGATFNWDIVDSDRVTMEYKVKFAGTGFDGPGTKLAGNGGKLPGLGTGSWPATGCRHATDGGSVRVMWYDKDGTGSQKPEFVAYTYTRHNLTTGHPLEGSDRSSTTDPNDRCGAQLSLSPRVEPDFNVWYRLVVDVNITNTTTGVGTVNFKAYGCDSGGTSCTSLLGEYNRTDVDFLDTGVMKVTQLLMHTYVGGPSGSPEWALSSDGDVQIKDVIVNTHNGTCGGGGGGTTPPPGTGWTECASEFGTCSFSGTKEVAYGANTSWNYGNYTTSVSCSNTTFGDPAPGTPKKCFYRTAPTSSCSLTNNATYAFKNVSSGRYMDVANFSTADGANIHQWGTTANADNRRFVAVDQGGGYFRLRSKHSSRYLDVAGATTNDGANLMQWGTGAGGTNTYFRFVSGPNGGCLMQPKNTVDAGVTRCIKVTGSADGANVEQGTCDNSSTRDWTVQLQ